MICWSRVPAQHGRRGDRPFGPGRRAELRAGGQAHLPVATSIANIFVLGDAAALPTSKSRLGGPLRGRLSSPRTSCAISTASTLLPTFDGHANCFIESGFGKGLLIDFNYDVEPLPGRYPLPGIGPFALLQESEMNHWGKMMFRWMYWNILLKGQELPLPARMSMAGKWTESEGASWTRHMDASDLAALNGRWTS